MYGGLLEALQSGATVVTANNRLARSLGAAYARMRRAAGDQAWETPRVLSWSAWLETLWAESEMAEGAATRYRLLSATEEQVLWERVAAEDLRAGMETLPIAGVAMTAWKLLCDWGGVGAPEWVATGLSPDQAAFVRWLAVYRDRCAANGWIDNGRLPAILLEDAKAGLFDGLGPLQFAGFDNWTLAQQMLRDALAARSVPVVVTEHKSRPAGRAVKIPCDSDNGELEQAARWARVQAEDDLDVCVIVRDLDSRAGETRRAFMDVFCPDWRSRESATLPVNFSYGEALAKRPRIAAALNILNLRTGDSSYQQFSLMLRTPFIGGGRSEADARAALDLRLRDKLGASFGIQDALSYAQPNAPDFALLLQALPKSGAESGSRTFARWADWIANILQAVAWPGDEQLDSLAYQELEAWHELLRDFAASSKVHDACEWPAALALLERLAGSRLFQPETRSGVVQVMGVLEAAGHEFDRLWVTGLAAEDWPPATRPNPLLPIALQRRLHMPNSSPEQDLTYYKMLTERLAGSAAEAVFSWTGFRDGEQLHASELIAELQQDHEPAVWGTPLWTRAQFATADREEIAGDRPARWPVGERAAGGAYLFNLQANCPLRAFLELRLGAREVDEPVVGLGYKERGSLAHRVLEGFYNKFPGSTQIAALDSATVADELNALLAQQIARLPGIRRSFMRTVAELETQRLLPLLLSFIELDRARESFSVTESEQERSVRVGPVEVGLKLDRMDELANGARLVIDYKTGNVARRNWNPARPGDMQLPLYANFSGVVVNGVAYAQISAQEVRYDGLADDLVHVDGVAEPGALKGNARFRNAAGEAIEDWDELQVEWQDCLYALAEGFAAGVCSINPKQSAKAEGQFAVLTRVYELPGVDADDGVNDD